MRRLSATIATACAAVIPLSMALALADPSEQARTKEIGRTTEREIKVNITSAFGTVIIGKGDPGKILQAESLPTKETPGTMEIEYAVRNRVGFLDIQLGEDEVEREGKSYAIHFERFDRGKWYLRFSEALPISFDVTLGVGRGDFNLSGLDVKDFNLSTGASDVTLAFDEPNTGRIENLNIESGLSKFDARNLGNANFRHFHFQGGMGSYTLDFGGELNNEVDVDIEVGLGLVTILIPEDVGARVLYEDSWVSKLDCDRDFRADGENAYLSENYHSAAGRMNINIDSGFGSIKVRRR